MTTAQLEYLDELVAQDEAAATALAELNDLLSQVAAVRESAEDVQRELELGPAEIEQRGREARDAAKRLEAAGERLGEAEREVASARESTDDGRVREAERALVAARDSAHIAERAAREAEKALAARRDQLAKAESERPVVEGKATSLAESLRGRPRLPAQVARPPAGLQGVSAWAVEARAALVVARSAVAGEREQAIRQAGELGALVTGSALPPSSMAAIAAAIRETL